MMQIIRAEKSDWPIIAQIAQRSWRVGYAPILSADQIEFMLTRSYSQEGLSEAMDQGQEFFLLSVEGVYVGFIAVFPRDSHILRIEKLYLLPDTQGKGFGRMLIGFAVEQARQTGHRLLELNVNRKNKACHFYLNQGFRIVQEVDIPYHGYVLDDYIMQLEIFPAEAR